MLPEVQVRGRPRMPSARARTGQRRWVAAALAALLVLAWLPLLTVALVAVAPPAHAAGGTTLVNETFQGSSVVDPNFRALGSACLTGAAVAPPVGQSNLGVCASSTGGAPTVGVTPGYLQLTDASGNQAGAALYNAPIPASAGLDVTFDQWQYGGSSADGITFFLANGSGQLNATGAPGGSLGYAQRNGAPGVMGGYVGIGLDVYGNFWNDSEQRGIGCPPGQVSPVGTAGTLLQNSVTVRGPGTGTNGYCWLGSTHAGNVTTLPSALHGASLATGLRTVHIVISPAPSPTITVQIDFHGGLGFQTVLTLPAPPGTPPTYKFGLVASTGGSTDVHLIRNLNVSTVNALPALTLVKQLDTSGAPPSTYTAGTVLNYQFVVTNTGGVPVHGLAISDPLVSNATCATTTLNTAPGVGSSTTCTGTHTITVGEAAAGTLTNTASASAIDPGNATVTSNNSSVTVNFKGALSLTKSVVTAGPYSIGQTVTYKFNVTNTGNVDLNLVSISDNRIGGVLPCGGLLAAGASTSCTGTYTIAAGAISVISPGQTGVTNTATASGLRVDNNATVTSPASSVSIPINADIQLTKSVDKPLPNVGDTVTFTVSAKNAGPSDAPGVQVTDLLPAGLTYVSSVPSQGTYTSGTGLWNIGTITNGATATLTLKAKVTVSTPVTNTASVTASGLTDPVPANNTASALLTPQIADMSVTKAVDNASPNVGDTVTFTVTTCNNGPNAATNVLVNDLLPAGLSFVSAVPTQGAYNAVTGLWTVGSVANSACGQLTLKAKVVGAAPSTNTATVSADQFDPNAANNTASATVTPQQADLNVTKTVDNPTPNVGQVVTFTITATDVGPNAATGVSLRDVLPAGLTFVSATPSVGTYVAGTGIWTLGTLPVATPATLIVHALVATAGTSVNTASVLTSDQFDPNPANNSASATVTPQQADLTVTKTVNNPTPNVGGTVTFTVVVHNNGPNAATGVQLTDQLPAGLSFVSAVPTQGSYNSGTGVWTIGTISNGGSVQLSVLATVTAPNSATNVATVTAVDQFDPNPANNSSSATITPQQADVSVTKTVDNPTPNVGDTVTFTLTVGNAGPDVATGVQVNDLLPAGLSFVSATPSTGSYNAVTGIWTVGSVAVGATATLLIHATVTAPGALTNTATVAADQFDPNLANNTSSVSETPQQADLSLTKTVDVPAPNVGQNVTYTVTLTNNGPDSATNVSVSDLLPAGLAFVSATPSQGAYDSTTGLWSVGTVANGVAVTLQIVATVNGPASQTNHAAITAVDQFDPNPGNNIASATITPQQADVSVTKSVNDPTPNVGQQVIFTVTVSDLGPDAATGVNVTDLLPSGLAFVSATPSQGTYDSSTGLWAVGTVGNGASRTLTVVATVTSPAAQINTATVMADQFDPNAGNNSATVVLTPQQSDLAITKTVDNATPNVGDQVTFTVTATNNGPDTATGVVVADALPAGLALVSAVPSQGSYSAGAWTVGSVAVGTPATLTVVATVTSPNSQTNTATVTAAAQFDPDVANNSASVTIVPQQADLSVAKTVDQPAPNVNDTVTFTVTVTNNGPDAATGVSVHDALPAGLSFVSAVPSQGSYSSGPGTWVVGTVANGGSATLTVSATVLSASASTNTASIAAADQFDPDTTNDSASATVTPQQADLALTKTVDNAKPLSGQTVTFTITLTNNGPDGATGVAVNDLLPAGLVFVSDVASQGSYNSSTGVWTVAAVANGATATLTIQATISGAVTVTNVATVSAADQFDPDAANNTASVTVSTEQAELAVTKTVNNSTPNVGDLVTYTVTLTNNGPDTATGVVLGDALPAGLVFVSATPSQGTYVASTGLWTVGTVLNGAHPTLIIRATVTGAGPITNTVTVIDEDELDPAGGDNTDSVTVTPMQADLSLVKTASASTVVVGSPVVYTLVLHNHGPGAAAGVVLTDALPNTLRPVSTNSAACLINGQTVTCTFAHIASGVTVTIHVTAMVNATGQITNTARVASGSFDPVISNNSGTAVLAGVAKSTGGSGGSGAGGSGSGSGGSGSGNLPHTGASGIARTLDFALLAIAVGAACVLASVLRRRRKS
jgi:uncharacterized repeat protein (TIGR01451 family)